MDVLKELVAQLQSALGANAVIVSAPEMEGYTEDWRGRFKSPALCVALPANTEQVALVVKACAAHGVPMLPQGGNTSLCGGSVPNPGSPPPVIINLARMRTIRDINPANNSMVVDAGCILQTVQQAAVDANRLYPISLGAEGSCQIGGTLATNAGGTSVVRYGNTRDNVLGLEAVLPDGTIWNGLRALRKDNTGLDLKHLFIGAEGALGIITGATLKLHPLPADQAMAWFAPADPEAALKLLGRFQQACGSRLSAYEMMNDRQLELVIKNVPNRRNPLQAMHPWHVLVELADTQGADEMNRMLLQLLEQGMEDGLVVDAVVASSQAQRAALWEIRHSVSEANKKEGVGLTTDCAVPVSAVPAFIEQATAAVHREIPGLDIIVVGHVGDGNIHFIPMFGFDAWQALPDTDEMGRRMRHCVNQVAHQLGGTFSAEHGIGQTGLPEMTHYKSAVELALMKTVKQALDPRNLMNPGRLLP